MRRLDTRVLSGFNDFEIDRPTVFEVELPGERSLDYETMLGNTPALTSVYDGLHKPQMVLAAENGLPIWNEHQAYPVGRLATFHGRNLEILARRVAVQDEFGNEYHSLCIKGSNLADPHLMESDTAERDYIIHGLQESLVMERVLRASRLLRENEIDTEYICGLVLPMNFPIKPSDLIELPESLDMPTQITLPELLEKLASRLAETNEEVNGKSGIELKMEMIERFRDCDYLVSYRAMDCPYRARDLEQDLSFMALLGFLRNNYEGQIVSEILEHRDRRRFIQEYFAPELARNLADLHKLGIRHGFITRQNVTALGSIVDLDSCRGEALGLGDEESTEKDYLSDVFSAMSTLRIILQPRVRVIDQDEVSRLRKRGEIEEATFWSSAQFLHGYVMTRFSEPKSRSAFLADMLVAANTWWDSSGDSAKKMALNEQILSVAAIIRHQNKLSAEQHLDLFDTDGIEEYCQYTYLKQLPPIFFQKIVNSVSDDGWRMNEKLLPEGQTVKGNIYHPLKASLERIVLGFFMDKLDKNRQDINSDDILFSVGAMAGFIEHSPDEERGKQLKNARAYFNQHTRKLIELLARRRVDDVKPEIKEVLPRGIEDHTGIISTEIDEKYYPIPVVFIDREEWCVEIIDSIERQHIPITNVTHIDLEELFKHPSETVMIADYNVTEWLSEQTNEESAFTALFKVDGARPLMFLRQSDNEGLRVYFVDNEFKDTSSTQVSLTDLKLKYVPSVYSEELQDKLSLFS